MWFYVCGVKETRWHGCRQEFALSLSRPALVFDLPSGPGISEAQKHEAQKLNVIGTTRGKSDCSLPILFTLDLPTYLGAVQPARRPALKLRSKKLHVTGALRGKSNRPWANPHRQPPLPRQPTRISPQIVAYQLPSLPLSFLTWCLLDQSRHLCPSSQVRRFVEITLDFPSHLVGCQSTSGFSLWPQLESH